MVVDPWGTIVNQLYEESEGYLITTLKKSMVVDVRTRMPVLVSNLLISPVLQIINHSQK